jgi:hypothetical protein
MTRLAAAPLLVTLWISGAAAAALLPGPRETILAEGLDAYDRGIAQLRANPAEADAAFRAAAEKFQLLVDDGVVNGRLQYNLGNAHVQRRQVGRAILAYRAAAQLIPGDPRLESNLAAARAMRRSQIAPSGGRALGEALLGWHRRLPLPWRWSAFTIAYLITWAALSIHVLRPARWLGFTAAAAAVGWVAAAASLAAQLVLDRATQGVILVDEVIARKGNGEGFEPQFAQPLHQGVEFRVIEQRPGWLWIELPDGNRGWIRADQAGLVPRA